MHSSNGKHLMFLWDPDKESKVIIMYEVVENIQSEKDAQVFWVSLFGSKDLRLRKKNFQGPRSESREP